MSSVEQAPTPLMQQYREIKARHDGRRKEPQDTGNRWIRHGHE